jgi:hypothetical protein
MPVLGSSAYNVAGDVTTRMRTILNDSEVTGGDVLTDTAVFTFDLLNSAFERVQLELASVGVEVQTAYAWLIALPSMPKTDPEARLIVDDTGANIIYPNGIGNVFSLTPQLPTDLILPLKLWERQSGTANYTGPPMKQPNDGLLNMVQQTYLVDWEWKSEGLRFRGALQVQDVKIMYEKALRKLVAPTDPVPIRGVVNAAAFFGAKTFCASRGGAITPQYEKDAMDEIYLLKAISTRRRQRKQVRRQPYSGRGGRSQQPII